LYTTPVGANWNSLIDYYGDSRPFIGYEGEVGWKPYPGAPMGTQQLVAMLRFAEQYLGYPYVWGGKSPPGFDCSGFVGYVYKSVGIIPDWVVSYTGTLMDYCNRVPDGDQMPGDLVFWRGTSTDHVGIYVGNGMILDCSGGGVDYRPLSWHSAMQFLGYYRNWDSD